MRDGFFHADMHQGNLLVERDGTVVAVDFGIMGRLGKIERRFLAEILHGLITRDYTLAAQIHFDAGYVPARHPVAVFAQAMRAVDRLFVHQGAIAAAEVTQDPGPILVVQPGVFTTRLGAANGDL
jgi:predicted unusual protein kinase regulating ubiquinone biosynthesis (AarF/ABC1/UbiB family)